MREMQTVYEYWSTVEARYRAIAKCFDGWLREHYLRKAQRIAEGLEYMPLDLAAEPVVLGYL